ncbi:MAG: TolC family protein [Bacteroidota bacterium]
MGAAFKFRFLFLLLLPLGTKAANDTLHVSIKQADSIFLANNYDLLASALNIDAQKAQIIQAKLYPNPVATVDVNAYRPDNQTFFNTGAAGQKTFQLEQLILLGGKRKSQIDLARSDARIAELEFQELIRQLRFKLHTGLHALNQQRTLLVNYNNQLVVLDNLLTAYNEQVNKGNLPLKDLVRLKGVYLNLNNDRAQLLKEYLADLTEVQTILQTSRIVSPMITETDLSATIKMASLDELKNLTINSRPDYLISQEIKESSKINLQLQKRLAVPDVNVFTSYDQRGGAFNNQINLGVSIPLPLWNRNQGNIKTASILLEQSNYNEEAHKNRLFAELANNYSLYTQTVSEYQKLSSLYNTDFEVTLQGVSDNFRKQNVSIIEFVDFFEAYNLAIAEIARIKIQLATSAEQLNLTIGKEVF